MQQDYERKLNRDIIRGQVLAHPDGQRLTEDALNRAVDIGVEAWKGQMGCGPAAEIGVRAVTAGVFKPKP